MQEKSKNFRSLFGMSELFSSNFHIESSGPNGLVIEGFSGIQIYEPNKIQVGAKHYTLLITGDELIITNMFGDTLCISGHIAAIEYI